MKQAFSLLELIFAIVVIGIIASFAVPKYMDTRNHALATTIKRDLVSATSAIQSYYLINRKIENISDAITLNETNWTSEAKKITFKDSNEICLELVISDNKINIEVKDLDKSVCKALKDIGVKTQNFDLI